MKKIYKIKSFISLSLLSVILFSAFSFGVSASNNIIISDAEHKRTIEQFLREIQELQNQVFDIAQSSLRNPSQPDPRLMIRINLINNNIERLNKVIQDYLATIPGVNERSRHVLLTFNVLNLLKSSLYTLSLLINTTDDMRRLELLDEFFSARVTALNTLEILQELLSNFGTN